MIRIAATSLLVIDVQCGFSTLCPAELPVPGGLEVVPKINRLLKLPWARIDATQDWHPPNHCSFKGQRDNLYPPHCVMDTRGAEFLPGLHSERFQAIWRKGFQRDADAYAVTAQHPAFVDFLRHAGVEHVVVCGLALNICCFFTARDLARAGFEVTMVEDASAGIDVPVAKLYQDEARAAAAKIGIHYTTTQRIIKALSSKTSCKRASSRK